MGFWAFSVFEGGVRGETTGVGEVRGGGGVGGGGGEGEGVHAL